MLSSMWRFILCKCYLKPKLRFIFRKCDDLSSSYDLFEAKSTICWSQSYDLSSASYDFTFHEAKVAIYLQCYLKPSYDLSSANVTIYLQVTIYLKPKLWRFIFVLQRSRFVLQRSRFISRVTLSDCILLPSTKPIFRFLVIFVVFNEADFCSSTKPICSSTKPICSSTKPIYYFCCVQRSRFLFFNEADLLFNEADLFFNEADFLFFVAFNKCCLRPKLRFVFELRFIWSQSYDFLKLKLRFIGRKCYLKPKLRFIFRKCDDLSSS